MAVDMLTLSSDDEGSKTASTSKTKPKPRPSTASTSSALKKKLAPDSDEEMEDAKPTVSKKVVKRKTAVESSDDDEPASKGKGKAKVESTTTSKRPLTKKPKVEDNEQKPKPTANNWAWKNKTGPENPGSKEIPVGKDNCLAGLTFVFTGELSSLSREEGQDLAKRYGGRVTSAPSSKTSYVVLGKDAGPKKLEMIAKHKLKTLDEDGFLELIGKRPSGASDPNYIEQKKKEEQKIKAEAMTLGPKPGAVENKTQLWTVKYAPTKLSEICGNKGSVEKLSRWLEAWPKSLKSDFKKPGPDAMGVFRCVLISGPPGIGKTTAAHLVAKLLGYSVLELNASDTRSKKLLETAFRSTIENTTLSGLFRTSDSKEGDEADISVNKKSVIIMDEVDGMSAGDRGGVGALNALIKKTKIPIIAICNDKSQVKMKPLISTCYQMPFKRPNANEIRGRMMTVAFKEGIKVDGKVMDQLVAGSQSDIRQIVNMLSTWKLGAKAMDYDEGKQLAKMNEKNAIQTPWTLYGKLFGPQAFSPVSGMSLNDKLDCFFGDFSLMPLFVQDNYLKASFSKASGEAGHGLTLKKLELMSKAADSMSEGDLMDKMIHTSQEWGLLPNYGMASCVRPASYCYGTGGGWAGFPTWFGKNSTQGKLQRLLGEVQIRMRLRVSGDRREIRQSYLPTLFQKIVTPLQDRGIEGIDEVIQVMDEYYLTKEDWDAIVEMGVGEEFTDEAVLKRIPAAVKSAFTRQFNKAEHPQPFYRDSGAAKLLRKKTAGEKSERADFEDIQVDDMDEEELEDDAESDSTDDIGKDKFIKAKGKSKAPAKEKGVAKAPTKPRKTK